MKLTRQDYDELNRLVHADQARETPRFSEGFAKDWFSGRQDYFQGYGATQYFEVEPLPKADAPAPSGLTLPGTTDDIPF